MAAGATYEPIATTTLGSNQTDISFTSISSSYTDIVCVLSAAGSSDNLQVGIRFNNDTGSNYSTTELYGTGTTAGSYRSSSNNVYSLSANIAIKSTLGYSNYIVHVMNYANSTTYKTAITRTNSLGSGYPGSSTSVGLWRSTAAINRIDFIGAFLSGSVITLYGITAA